MNSGESGVSGGLVDSGDIKQELDTPGYSGDLALDTPRSWDSGVALDSVTALQMAEFQTVVDNLHRQVVGLAPPPYPGQDMDSVLLTSSLLTGAHTYQPGHHGSTQKYENPTKNGCQSLPANGLIPSKIIDKVENKYTSNQRY